ncbi:unnamed protein product [Calicophoron daubneyi]|uniref:Transmembrane 9 superfamily member n=1 Tax=Calicophoron daubneyi TaxID=300641 RepID=A0AAV2TYV5_CALDB
MKVSTLSSCLCLLLGIEGILGFYLPGLAPTNYCPADQYSPENKCKTYIPVYVNKLTSTRSFISFSYDTFDFCPTSAKDFPVENLGQVVFGERLQPSDYLLSYLKSEPCKKLCTKTYRSTNDKAYDFLRNAIVLQYSHHWVVDNLPVTVCVFTTNNKRFCSVSIPLGCFGEARGLTSGICEAFPRSKNNAYILNHVHFKILYNPVKDSWTSGNVGRIVAIEAIPRSINHPEDKVDCTVTTPMMLPGKQDSEIKITYSYGVSFEENHDVKWASRWDYILQAMPQSNIQWLSILNSVVLVLFLSGLVAIILVRTLRRDIARYSQLEGNSEVQEESGWKLVHGDVFRPPTWGMFLSVLLGSGSQIFLMVLVTLFFACLGFLSPANRGAFMTCTLAMFACAGILGGYVSARIYKFIGGLRWKTNILLTATFCPAVVFSTFFVLNLALWILQSASAMPFGTIVALLALWFGVSLPLCFIGAFFGFRKSSIEVPVRTNQIPRQIPFLTAYSRPVITFFLGGLLPFSCIFIQLFFIFNSIWGTQFYFMFGLLFLVFLMLVITCSETAMLLCYFQLCSEDYRWWWRAFHCGAGTSFYLFIYSLHYFISRLEFKDGVSGFLYFGYIFIIVWLAFLLTGTIGFFACFWFVRKIYAVVKVD